MVDNRIEKLTNAQCKKYLKGEDIYLFKKDLERIDESSSPID